MFESLDESEQKARTAEDPVTLAEALTVYVLILVLASVSLVAFFLLGDLPFGMQYATLISYSGAIFIWTFFRTKGVNTKYRLSATYVQGQLPRLLLIHSAYLLSIFFIETVLFALRPAMSVWWLGSKHQRDLPPFVAALMFSLMAIGIWEVVICRGILGRAKRSSSEFSKSDD
jgi:hypothetical protein